MPLGNYQVDDAAALQKRVGELEKALDACETERDMYSRNEQRYRMLVEECPLGVVIHSDEEIVYANKFAARIVGGVSPATLIGRAIWDFVSDDRREHLRSKSSKLDHGDGHVDFAIQELKALDGRVVCAEVMAIPVVFEGQIATLAVFRDVTAREEAEDERQQQQALMAHTQRLATVGEMSSELMHEVNNPIVAISMFSQAALAAMDSPVDPMGKIREYLTQIRDQSQRAGAIIARMRTFARSSEPELSALSLNEIIRNLVPLFDIEANRFRACIAYVLSESLPDVKADRLLIEQVLVNLVRNGVESMAAVPIDRRRLLVETSLVDGEVEVIVRDRGTGIPPGETSKVFDRFYTNKENGVGLGLAISKTIIESHQGRIWVSRNKTHGVTFHFTLPVVAE